MVAAGLTAAEARSAGRTLLDAVTAALERGEAVELDGFGTFRRERRRVAKPGNRSAKVVVEVAFFPDTGILDEPPGAEAGEPRETFPDSVAEPEVEPAGGPWPDDIVFAPAHIVAIQPEIVFELPDQEDDPEPVSEPLPLLEFDFPLPDRSDPGPVGVLGRVGAPLAVTPALPSEAADLRRESPPTLEDLASRDEVDFDTHYNLGISYKEMGLIAQAIGEFQRALYEASPDGGDPRYINCCGLLGICHREAFQYASAIDWFRQALDLTPKSDARYLALQYELGLTYEQYGQLEAAMEAYAEVYALDVSFRDIVDRVTRLEGDFISRQERMRKTLPVRIRGIDTAGGPYVEETWVTDVSRRGAGLKTRTAHEPGTVIEVTFTESSRYVLGRVVWCAPTVSDDGTFRMGLTLLTDAELGVGHWPPVR